MKCELCHKNDATKAITVEKNGKSDELYVCAECAGKSEAPADGENGTEDASDSQPQTVVTVTGISSGEKPPPIVEAIIGAFDNALNMLSGRGKKAAKKKFRPFPVSEVPPDLVLRGMFHLEGCFLSGQSQCVIRAAKAIGLSLEPAMFAGHFECTRLFTLKHAGEPEKARRFAMELARRERIERENVFKNFPIVLIDAASRSIGVLQNCKLLAPDEVVDLLCPLRFAVAKGLVSGISRTQIEELAEETDTTPYSDDMSNREIDDIEAMQAKEVSALFKKVRLTSLAGKLL